MRNDEGKLYDSYVDYWILVDLSGFKKCELSEIDRDSDNVYIFSPVNGNTSAFMASPHKARFIAWQLERPSDMKMHIPDGITEMWFSDPEICNQDKRMKPVVLGGHPKLGNEKLPPKYDFALMCYLYGKRDRQISELKRLGWRCSGNSYYLPRRNMELQTSKYGLCLHQDDEPIIEPLRFVLFACYKLALVVEHSNTYYPYNVIELYPLNTLKDRLSTAQVVADENYNLMTKKLTFRKCIEDALKN